MPRLVSPGLGHDGQPRPACIYLMWRTAISRTSCRSLGNCHHTNNPAFVLHIRMMLLDRCINRNRFGRRGPQTHTVDCSGLAAGLSTGRDLVASSSLLLSTLLVQQNCLISNEGTRKQKYASSIDGFCNPKPILQCTLSPKFPEDSKPQATTRWLFRSWIRRSVPATASYGS